MKTSTITNTIKALVVAGAILGTTTLSADGGTLFNKCAGCHGKTAQKSALGKSKIINEMSKEDLVLAINGYKDGTYGGAMKALMKGQVAKLSKEEVDSLTTYITTLKKGK